MVEFPHDGDAVDQNGLAWNLPKAELRPRSTAHLNRRGPRMNERQVWLIQEVGRLRERRPDDRTAKFRDAAIGVFDGQVDTPIRLAVPTLWPTESNPESRRCGTRGNEAFGQHSLIGYLIDDRDVRCDPLRHDRVVSQPHLLNDRTCRLRQEDGHLKTARGHAYRLPFALVTSQQHIRHAAARRSR